MDKIYVFLNGSRGRRVLETVTRSDHKIAGVFVPRKLSQDAAMVETCSAADVKPVGVSNVNSKEFVSSFEAMEPNLAIIAGFSDIFQAPLISAPKYGTINLHAGRLPQYRGGSPLNWQIINGEVVAGCSVVRVDEGIDTGAILAEGTFPISERDSIGDLHDRANELFPDLVLQAIGRVESGEPGTPQDEAGASYWHQRSDGDGLLHWERLGATAACRLVRALTHPYPGAFTYLDGKTLRIFGATIPKAVIRGVPGRVVWLQGTGPYVVCRDRAILLREYALDSADSEVRVRHGVHLG